VLVRSLVRRDTYYDSVKLMRVSEALAKGPGIVKAAALMATPLNIDLLADEGLLPPNLTAGPEDLLVTVMGEDEPAVEGALAELSRLLEVRATSPDSLPTISARSLEQAARAGGSNLAVIAVPGSHAAAEAYIALRSGLHVFLFSDNVSREDEVRLKHLAAQRDLLMMGPDCGTAIIDGVGLGFANRVQYGPVGIVGASGTGIQQLCCLLDLVGVGVAQAVGTGGRDLSSAVGGSMTIRAVRMLAADNSVEVIAVISKPADPAAARRLHQELLGTSKPAVVCLLGETPGAEGSVRYAQTLTDLATIIVDTLGMKRVNFWPPSVSRRQSPSRLAAGLNGGRQVYGLFTGGTLCSEAGQVLESMGVPHHLVDLGADEFTRGRAHPIMDPRLRTSMLADLAERDDVGAVLVDVILGDLAHADPARALLSALGEIKSVRSGAGDPLDIPLVAVMLGTRRDPQNLEDQRAILTGASIPVFPSNAQAARYAADLARRRPRSANPGRARETP